MSEPTPAPAEQAPVAPVEPAAPVAPEPASPTPEPTPTPAPEPPAPTPDDTETEEWDKVSEELFPGIKKAEKETKPEEKKPDEPAQPKEELKAPEADKAAPEEPKSEEKPDDEATSEQPDTSIIDARVAARRSAQELAEVKEDVRKQMFSDIPTEIKDAEGDPIRTVADVMARINPQTGEAFTEQEAATWLSLARQQIDQTRQQAESRLEYIAETNLVLKDESDLINHQFGELLKQDAGLRDKLWKRYEKTLVKDPKTGIIIDAPVSLYDFYATALEPYAELGRELEAKEDAKSAEQALVEQNQKKVQTHQDRSDIYGSGKVDDQTPEDKEWDEAATAVFGPRK